jgi:hypothetical protein
MSKKCYRCLSHRISPRICTRDRRGTSASVAHGTNDSPGSCCVRQSNRYCSSVCLAQPSHKSEVKVLLDPPHRVGPTAARDTRGSDIIDKSMSYIVRIDLCRPEAVPFYVFSSSLEDEPIKKNQIVTTNSTRDVAYNFETFLANIRQCIAGICCTVLEKIWRGSMRWPRLDTNIKTFASPG